MDFTDILIFVLAGIGVLVSAISKNAKKKAEEARRLTRPETPEWEGQEHYSTEYEDITPQIRGYDNPHPISPYEKTPWSYDQAAIRERGSSMRVDDLHRKPNMARQRIENMDTSTPNQTVSESSERVAAQQFSLRDAIVYSELLKPKHEKY